MPKTTLTYLDDLTRDDNTAVTVGTFDGIHLGHRTLIETLVNKAREIGGRSVLITFNPHPREVLHGGHNTVGLLTTIEERADILGELGVDAMVVIPFDRDFSLLSSKTFIREIIHERIGVRRFIIGYDHHFGRNREGTIKTVENLAPELGYDVHLVEAHEVKHRTVSSTRIRKALVENGDAKLAKSFLGRPYPLRGLVVHGDKRGRGIGYPTANIRVENERKVIPKNGVYAVQVAIEDRLYGGMMNIGVRPTVTETAELRLEVHIFDFDEDIYGRELRVYFHGRIRDEQKFTGLEHLKSQLAQDKADCIKVLKSVY